MWSRAAAHEDVVTAAERRPRPGEAAFWYGFAGVTYISISISQKWLLNWAIGPLWLVSVVWLGPLLGDRWRVSRRCRRQPQ